MIPYQTALYYVDGQPHLLFERRGSAWRHVSERPLAGPSSAWLAPSGRIHHWSFIPNGPQNLGDHERSFSWNNLPPMSVEEDVPLREALRILPRLSGRQWVCAVVGCKEQSNKYSEKIASTARNVGGILSEYGFAVLTGGLSGVMAAAAQGARARGGITIGILPSDSHRDANPHLDLVLPSGLGYARNYLIASSCDVLVALPGGTGTLEEICFALDFNKTVISLGSWEVETLKALPIDDEDSFKSLVRSWMNHQFSQMTVA